MKPRLVRLLSLPSVSQLTVASAGNIDAGEAFCRYGLILLTERAGTVLVSNSYSLSEDIPSIMFGLRGRINLSINVKSANPDLHSGMHGGICVRTQARK